MEEFVRLDCFTTTTPCSASWQVRHRAVLSQGNLFQTEIKLKYINVYDEILMCPFHIKTLDRIEI